MNVRFFFHGVVNSGIDRRRLSQNDTSSLHAARRLSDPTFSPVTCAPLTPRVVHAAWLLSLWHGTAHQLLSATWYMHLQGIVHRDLKLENVVYESKLQDADIFIIDYGLSKV